MGLWICPFIIGLGLTAEGTTKTGERVLNYQGRYGYFVPEPNEDSPTLLNRSRQGVGVLYKKDKRTNIRENYARTGVV